MGEQTLIILGGVGVGVGVLKSTQRLKERLRGEEPDGHTDKKSKSIKERTRKVRTAWRRCEERATVPTRVHRSIIIRRRCPGFCHHTTGSEFQPALALSAQHNCFSGQFVTALLLHHSSVVYAQFLSFGLSLLSLCLFLALCVRRQLWARGRDCRALWWGWGRSA